MKIIRKLNDQREEDQRKGVPQSSRRRRKWVDQRSMTKDTTITPFPVQKEYSRLLEIEQKYLAIKKTIDFKRV
jgi:hypothetical protein